MLAIRHCFFLIFSMLLLANSVKAQTHMNVDSLIQASINDEACTYYKDSTLKKEKHIFYKANRIELISFKSKPDPDDSLITGKRLVVGNIRQQKVLPLYELDSLYSMLYNYRSNQSIRMNMLIQLSSYCYDPHHAIIFYHDHDAIAFLEICFKCYAIKTDEISDYFGSCTEKMKYLHNLFSAYHVRYKLKE